MNCDAVALFVSISNEFYTKQASNYKSYFAIFIGTNASTGAFLVFV